MAYQDDFLDLPGRPAKPRSEGVTHVIDTGISLSQAEGMLETAGDYIDIVKLGWGSAYVTGNLEEKVALYRRMGADVVLGGTFWEICHGQGRLDDWRRFVDRLGLETVEVSDGALDIPHPEKLEAIAALSAEFRVLSEVGSKDNEVIIAPFRWVEMITAELEAGSWKVITEARESGTAGIYRGDGEVRMGLIEEISVKVPVEKLLFEAPQRAQQVWFIENFGPNVNLGNIPPAEVVSLETLRAGLRADTMPGRD